MAILTTHEMAHAFGVSYKTILHWNKEGRIVGRRDPGGKRWIFDDGIARNRPQPEIPDRVSILDVMLAQEARASISLDRDQTHVVDSRPLRDDDPPHIDPDEKVEQDAARELVTELQARLIEQQAAEIAQLEDSNRELLDQFKYLLGKSEYFVQKWRENEAIKKARIPGPDLAPLARFKTHLMQEAAAGTVEQGTLDYFGDILRQVYKPLSDWVIETNYFEKLDPEQMVLAHQEETSDH